METYTNPATGKGWMPQEEAVIERVMTARQVGRITAIQIARRAWLIGETQPPGWPVGRAKPGTSEPKVAVVKSVGRPRKHETNADRQRAYRRRSAEITDIAA